ncbi:MAG TPA: class I SAM-dependent RNA methyltransferase [Candidatus Dormibacteraeota bacterium]|nr:class I SAM-dependent RNA methyltransferase [Candidatus Dormibacteraeota bacterium]
MILKPESPAHGGACIAREDGKVWLVNYALPGEVVEAEPRGRQGGVAVASALQVIEKSPHRVPPKCPHFGPGASQPTFLTRCGGCQWQHADYAYQLVMKRQIVADAWRRAGIELPAETDVLGMEDPWRYRIRGEFEAIETAAGVRFGFHPMRSHTVQPITTCPIHDERIEKALFAFEQAINELRLGGIHTLRMTAEPGGPGLLWFLQFRGKTPGWPYLELEHRVAELLPGVVLLGDTMSLQFWDMAFRAADDTFVQTNYSQMLVLYEIALGMLAPHADDRVLDLYAGIGTISMAIARSGAQVTAVEQYWRAVQLGRLNARINTAKVEYLKGGVEDALKQVRIGQHNKAVLDPPRAGCEPEALAEILRLGPERLVYISCEPSTHARDLAALTRGGYRIERAAIVDMFPHTYHIESVALLNRS